MVGRRKRFGSLNKKRRACKHPIKYTIPNITKAAIPAIGIAAFAMLAGYFNSKHTHTQ